MFQRFLWKKKSSEEEEEEEKQDTKEKKRLAIRDSHEYKSFCRLKTWNQLVLA